ADEPHARGETESHEHAGRDDRGERDDSTHDERASLKGGHELRKPRWQRYQIEAEQAEPGQDFLARSERDALRAKTADPWRHDDSEQPDRKAVDGMAEKHRQALYEPYLHEHEAEADQQKVERAQSSKKLRRLAYGRQCREDHREQHQIA